MQSYKASKCNNTEPIQSDNTEPANTTIQSLKSNNIESVNVMIQSQKSNIKLGKSDNIKLAKSENKKLVNAIIQS